MWQCKNQGPGLSALKRMMTSEPMMEASVCKNEVERALIAHLTSNTDNITTGRINVVCRSGSPFDHVEGMSVETGRHETVSNRSMAAR